MEDNSTHISELLEDAALKGDVTTLRGLLGRDPHLLHRSSPSSSSTLALHIASKLGHLQFVQELLLLNPSLAEGLHPYERSTPLHLASGSGHVEVVKALVSSNACLCLARDVHGRNPAHVAAMKGHVDVLEELIKAVPAAARERALGGGDTIMHLCVKCNQLEALWVVARTVGDAGMLLNATDGDGNTILHIAVADKQLQDPNTENTQLGCLSMGKALAVQHLAYQFQDKKSSPHPTISVCLKSNQTILMTTTAKFNNIPIDNSYFNAIIH